MSRIAFPIALVCAFLGVMIAPFLILDAPMEATMGFVQRIFYFHVPFAMLTFLSVFLCAAGSVVYLAKSSSPAGARADGIAVAAAELAVVFGLCVLVTGPLWARKAWGAWWVWKDARLMTTLLLWFIFVAYLFVRRYGGPGSQRLAAGLALFAAADVPIIYGSVFFWRTQHPKATVVSTLDPAMKPALRVSMLALTILWCVLLALRYRLEENRRKLDLAHLAAEDAGLLD